MSLDRYVTNTDTKVKITRLLGDREKIWKKLNY